jgi:hypothetical protein
MENKSLYQYYIDRCNDIIKNTSNETISNDGFGTVEFQKCVDILLLLKLIDKDKTNKNTYFLTELGKIVKKREVTITIEDVENEIILNI